MRVNPNIVDIDIGENPLSEKEMEKFTMNLRRNNMIRKIGMDGIKNLSLDTKQLIEKEVEKNSKINNVIMNNIAAKSLDGNVLMLQN